LASKDGFKAKVIRDTREGRRVGVKADRGQGRSISAEPTKKLFRKMECLRGGTAISARKKRAAAREDVFNGSQDLNSTSFSDDKPI
jgi:hypothetical protein